MVEFRDAPGTSEELIMVVTSPSKYATELVHIEIIKSETQPLSPLQPLLLLEIRIWFGLLRSWAFPIGFP